MPGVVASTRVKYGLDSICLLIHGCGADQRRFYKRLIQVADERYDEHRGSLAPQSKENFYGKKTR